MDKDIIKLIHQYPFIEAWEAHMGSFRYYRDAQLKQAEETKAPRNALYFRDDAEGWRTLDSIANESLRANIIWRVDPSLMIVYKDGRLRKPSPKRRQSRKATLVVENTNHPGELITVGTFKCDGDARLAAQAMADYTTKAYGVETRDAVTWYHKQ
jgi:hypothetical protein